MKPSGRARLAPSSTISSSAFFCFFGGKSKDLQKRSPEVLFIYFQLKAECWRIDAFELWCWRSLLRFSWTARRSNQSILKEISPEYSSEGLMLKLKLQYFGHLMWRTDLLEKLLEWFAIPFSRDLPDPRIKPGSPAFRADSLQSEPPGKPKLFAAKLLQSCSTLCDPIDGSPPGSPVPEILQARTLE